MTSRPNPANNWLSAPRAAEYLGVKYRTFTSYLSRGQVPKPDGQDDDGRNRWKPSTLKVWQRNRPGSGTRTDLKRKREAGK